MVAFILSLFGVILIIEGIPYFAFPGKVKDWALILQEIPNASLRIMGLFSMAVGLMVLYMVKYFLR